MFFFSLPNISFSNFILIVQSIWLFVLGWINVYFFKKLTNYPLTIVTQILLTALYVFQNSTVGILIYLSFSIIILYFFNFKQTVSFNYISTVMIFDSAINIFASSIWWRIYELGVLPFYNNVTLTNVYTFVFQTLLSFITIYLLLKPLRKLINRFSQTTLIQSPIYSWIVNLFMVSFWEFRLCTALRIIGVSRSQYLIYMALYAIIVFLAIYLPTRSLEKSTLIRNQQIELENLAQYTSHIEAMYDELRRFRHDYKNILLSLNDAVESKDINQVSDIFKRVVIPTNNNVQIRTSVLGRLTNIDNLEIKSLVYSKTIEAINKRIQVEIEVENPIKVDPQVKITDMLRIIAILFDNAIHAAVKAQHPQINFSFLNEQNRQILIIGNSTAEKKLDLNKLTGHFNGVLTSNHHGLGLRNLRTILSRYSFIQNNRSSDNYWFEQEIIIYRLSNH